MSIAATAFAWQQSGLSPNAKLTLLALADFADGRMRTNPSARKLIDMTGLGKRALTAALDELVQARLVNYEAAGGFMLGTKGQIRAA